MGAIPISRRCRCMASCSRSRTLRTKDMRSTAGGDARYDIDFPAAIRARRAAPHQGGDHLRQGRQHGIQRAGGRSRRPPRTRQDPAVRAGLPAQHLGRQPRESLRHHPLRFARLELGVGRVGQRQSGDGQPRRGDAGVVSRTGQPQCGGTHPSAQVDAGFQRGRHRRGYLLRPYRHPLPHDRGLRQGPRSLEGPGRGLLRPAGPVHDRAALVGAEHAVREPREDAGGTERARGHAHRHRARVHGVPGGPKAEEPIVAAAAREIKAVLGGRLGTTLVESSDPLWRGSRHRGHDDEFRRALARLVPLIMPDLLFRLGRTGSRCSRSLRRRSCRPSSCPGRSPVRHHAADRLRVELAEGRITPPSNLDIATIQEQELAMAFRFHLPIPDPPGRGLEGEGIRRRSSTCHAQCAIQVLGQDQRAA